MKKLLMHTAWVAALMSTQAFCASSGQIAAGPVINGVSIAAFVNPKDMILELFVKQTRKAAFKQISFDKTSLIIPGIAALTAALVVKGYEYWSEEYDWRGYDKNELDYDGYDKAGRKYNGRNRAGQEVDMHGYLRSDPKPDPQVQGGLSRSSAGKPDKLERLKTLWQNARRGLGWYWRYGREFTTSRLYNPWNWYAAGAGLAVGTLAMSPTFWDMASQFSKNCTTEQEKVVDRVVEVWGEARRFFPEDLHNAFDKLQELKSKKSSDYAAHRTKVLEMIREGHYGQCPVV